MCTLYPHADDITRTHMARQFIDDVIHGGYIRELQSLSRRSGADHLAFIQEYATFYSVPAPAVLLFGPRGGARAELRHFVTAEKSHGMHRPGASPDPKGSAKTRRHWQDADRTQNWPTDTNGDGEFVLRELPMPQSHASDGISGRIREMWRRDPALRDYTGTNRLSGDTAFQVIEDVVHMLIETRPGLLNPAERARYDHILEQANAQGTDSFHAAYHSLFSDRDRWRRLWDMARQWLYQQSLQIWQKQNQQRRAEGSIIVASGVSFCRARSRKHPLKRNRYGVPGTLYLNNGRYWWVVAGKMRPRPLIDPKTKPKVPGTIFKDSNRYYWVIPGLLKRQRLVPIGQRFSATDRPTAERIAYRLWKQLQKDDPTLAQMILTRARSQGLATQDKTTAEKVAARLWRQIQQEQPQLAAKILQDNRPVAQDHWQARIKVNGRLRHIGNFSTRQEAEAAYAREFEDVWGSPPGCNVQTLPKLDKVWPSWQQEKARLDAMAGHPSMPIINPPAQMHGLAPMILQMQQVAWLAEHVILVFEDSSPLATPDIVIQSRGQRWLTEIKQQGRQPVIAGSASMDKDTRRIRITLYPRGLDPGVLAEELYHVSLKVIRRTQPGIFEALRRWYSRQLRNGADRTFSMPDVFAHNMAQEHIGLRTRLPRTIVNSAQRMLSASTRIPASVMHEVKATWSRPLQQQGS